MNSWINRKAAGRACGQAEKAAATLKKQKAALVEKDHPFCPKSQQKIDNIIGVKADVIEALQKEFEKNNVSVNIDSQTGALTLNASVLFDYDQAELTDEGKAELSNILPIYCKVLLQDEYKKYSGRDLLLTAIQIQTVTIPIT